ncbi:molybdopterin-dependent oxidoreductase [Halomonas sp. Bachu 37]|uniref:molybdopterin-dependent oxidoreductase n=1 Tax=Halomonas kashgarensis TaxID=3084920 RepID=UPI0032163093
MGFTKRQWLSALSLLVLVVYSTTTLADAESSLPYPVGPVVLKVTGNITHTNTEDEAHFDRAMLRDLPLHEFATTTPWTEGTSVYSGPLLRDFLDRLGAEGEQIHVQALNGYEAHIPLSDLDKYDVLLAMDRDGEAMPIRDYGPLWVLYPFDHHEELLSEKIRFRAVWQVMHIHVL